MNDIVVYPFLKFEAYYKHLDYVQNNGVNHEEDNQCHLVEVQLYSEMDYYWQNSNLAYD